MANTQAPGVVVTPKGQPIVCPACGSEDTTVNYEDPCPNGWTHWWTDSCNVGPDPLDGTKPVGLKCPGCGCDPVPAQFLECTSCGDITMF